MRANPLGPTCERWPRWDCIVTGYGTDRRWATEDAKSGMRRKGMTDVGSRFADAYRAQAHRSCCVETEADVVEPFGDQVFISGIPHVRVVQQQDRGPVNQVALSDQAKTFPLQRIGNVFACNDDPGFRNAEVSGRMCPFCETSCGLVPGFQIKLKDPC